jgi:hypothetical protein
MEDSIEAQDSQLTVLTDEIDDEFVIDFSTFLVVVYKKVKVKQMMSSSPTEQKSPSTT